MNNDTTQKIAKKIHNTKSIIFYDQFLNVIVHASANEQYIQWITLTPTVNLPHIEEYWLTNWQAINKL